MSMQSLLAATQSMARMQTIQSVRTQAQGTANVLRSESKQDGGNASKDAKAEALEEKSNNLMGDLMEEVTDVSGTLQPDEETAAGEIQEESSSVSSSRMDTVTLSDGAPGANGAAPKANLAAGEAVTFDAGGSKTPSVPAQAAPAFQATA